jgi:hypothetical protein
VPSQSDLVAISCARKSACTPARGAAKRHQIIISIADFQWSNGFGKSLRFSKNRLLVFLSNFQFPDPSLNSLIGRQKNSLLSPRSELGSSSLNRLLIRAPEVLYLRELGAKFPCNFPVIREIDAETGSTATASATKIPSQIRWFDDWGGQPKRYASAVSNVLRS